MKNLNVCVSGKVTTGNSYLVYEIRRLLRNNGWNVEHDYNSKENDTEIDLDHYLCDNLENKINKLKKNVVISIIEKQLER